MKTLLADTNLMTSAAPARVGRVRDWQHWTPFAAVAWSLAYAALGIYWAAGGSGFPYAPEIANQELGPLLGRFGPQAAWVVVIIAGIPAAVMGTAMLRGVRSRILRPLLVTAGILLAGALLLLMTSLTLLVAAGYIPYFVKAILTGDEFVQVYLKAYVQWSTIHQLLCLLGGFVWLAATASYARLSSEACLYCGRREGPEGWQSPDRAASWGRTAVYIAMAPPVFYAFTRYAWALGIPLGMSEAYLRQGQESGMWISGLFLASFGLVGALLMLGLVQRWGEVFPRWMVGLAGRRVPIALAVVPATIAAVLAFVGGIGIWSGLGPMVANMVADGGKNVGLVGGLIFHLGPTLLFPIWGAALAAATLAYYYRRRGPCKVCGRGE